LFFFFFFFLPGKYGIAGKQTRATGYLAKKKYHKTTEAVMVSVTDD
jgi:hypothetical protein